MDEQTNTDILERIHASYYTFTSAERRVADYVLSNAPQVQFMSISQLADECGSAEATISRFCRSMKLKGFNAFKIEIARHCAGANTQAQEQAPTTVTGYGLEVGRLATEAIYQTIERLDQEQVLRAVELIEGAERVLCFGSGGSNIMASECAHLFSTVGAPFSAMADSHIQMSAAATMGPKDAIMLFSYSGATNNGLQLLELAKSREIPTILVTRYHRSPAAKLADVLLCCGSNEGPFQLGSVPARIAQLIVIDILFQEYYHRNRERCDRNLDAIASALSGMHI